MSENVLLSIIAVSGTLIGALIGFFGNVLLEKKRAKNDSRIYITKAQFDFSFEVYKKLSKATYQFLIAITPFKEGYRLSKGRLEEKNYSELIDACADIQDLVAENAPFIPSELYLKISDLESDIRDKFWVQLDSIMKNNGEHTAISREEFKEIEKKIHDVNDEIRTLLSRLTIVE